MNRTLRTPIDDRAADVGRRRGEPAADARPEPAAASRNPAAAVIAMQRTLGNRAVSRMLGPVIQRRRVTLPDGRTVETESMTELELMNERMSLGNGPEDRAARDELLTALEQGEVRPDPVDARTEPPSNKRPDRASDPRSESSDEGSDDQSIEWIDARAETTPAPAQASEIRQARPPRHKRARQSESHATATAPVRVQFPPSPSSDSDDASSSDLHSATPQARPRRIAHLSEMDHVDLRAGVLELLNRKGGEVVVSFLKWWDPEEYASLGHQDEVDLVDRDLPDKVYTGPDGEDLAPEALLEWLGGIAARCPDARPQAFLNSYNLVAQLGQDSLNDGTQYVFGDPAASDDDSSAQSEGDDR